MSDFTRGMKAKTIKAVISKKVRQWTETIDDEAVRKLAQRNTIVTGGCIASMLMGDEINDFDIYFSDQATTEAVGKYYVDKFVSATNHPMKLESLDGRIRIVTESGHRGETAGEVATMGAGEIEDVYDELSEQALEVESEGEPKFRPVFMSTNAITLSDKVQIVLRFYGDPDKIHENYDFVHCTNYWTSLEGKLVLRQPALEAILSRELRYVGSKYPVCSVIRLRKFIKRGWVVNAGQILKMMMQISELNLTDPAILEDQLTGVDSAYFCQMIEQLREKDSDKVDVAYLVEIIDRIF
jgi:hypothetical protein